MSQANASMLLVGLPSELEGRLAASVSGVAVQRAAADLRSVGEAVSRLQPTSAVVALPATAPEAALRLVALLAHAGARVIAVGPSKDAELILQAMRAGAQEFVVQGDEKDLARAVRSRGRAADDLGIGGAIAVFGAKGGVGATAAAVSLAGTFARRGERTCLVDLDHDFGDALAVLDLAAKYDLHELRVNMPRLDRELLDASLARHRSGLFVVGPAERAEDAPELPAKDVGEILGFLRQHFRHVIVDGLRGLEDLSVAALDAADAILLVVTQEVAAVRNAQRARALFRRLGYDDRRLRLVVNRLQKASKISLQLVADTVGLPVAATLANDYASLVDAVQKGAVVPESAPRSPLTRDLSSLADALAGPGETSTAARPLWSRLFARG